MNVRSGHVYERRLVAAHVAAHGADPVTREPCSAGDLVALQGVALARPRPVAAASVAGMLGALQSEWDAQMLEHFELRRTLEDTRRELSQTLYQHDAAVRLIARLVRERDAARQQLADVQSMLVQQHAGAGSAGSSAGAGAGAGAAGDAAMSEDGAAGGIPEEVLAAAKDKHKELSKQRKAKGKAPPPAGCATLDQVRSAAAAPAAAPLSFSPHAPSAAPGVTCFEPMAERDAGAAAGGGASSDVAISGGMDGSALVLDIARGAVLARLAGGHAKRVSGVAAHPSRDAFVTASHDGTVKVWSSSSASASSAASSSSSSSAASASSALSLSSSYGVAATLKPHGAGQSEVVGLALHPLGDFAVSGGRDGTWAFSDIGAGRVLSACSMAPGSSAGAGAPPARMESLRLHPDGLLAMLGASDGSVRVIDLRTSQQAHAFVGHAGAVSCLAISENGYTLASGGADAAKVWDLRKLALVRDLAAPGVGGARAACSALAFDVTGQFLAVGSAAGVVALYDAKAAGASAAASAAEEAPLPHLRALAAPAGAHVTGLVWGANARSLAVASMDRAVLVHRVVA